VYGFNTIIDQQRPVRILSTFLRKKTFPHALLFTGIDGIGKTAAAVTFAMACNCKRRPAAPAGGEGAVEPCGSCRSCRKILSDTHPDVIRIIPAGAFIRIAQIRELCDGLTLKPYEAQTRLVLLADAHKMNPHAGNALLKMLEEPPARTVLILIAPEVADLLPTIVSRCQTIRFNPVSRESISRRLQSEGGSPETARILAVMADGSLTRAVDMLKSDWMEWRNRQLAAAGLDAPGRLQPERPGRLLASAETLAAEKQRLPDALAILSHWIRDLIVWKYDPARILNVDLADRIESMSASLSLTALISGLEVIRRARSALDANANLRLTVETMMLRLAKAFNS
jgi:DNA polymerase-3 subunit delta'